MCCCTYKRGQSCRLDAGLARLQSEVGAATSSTRQHDTQRDPRPSKARPLVGVAMARAKAWARVWKSELLFLGCLSLATMTGRGCLLQGSWWMAREWPAIGSRSSWQHCFHTWQHDPWQFAVCLCSAASRGLVSLAGVLFGISFVYLSYI
jgi:hypothetical protein